MRFYYFLTSLLNPMMLGWMRLKTRFRPRERVRVILFDKQGRVLLVRPVIGIRKWELPGGMPRRDETFEAAAARELREETGLKINKTAMRFVIEYLRPYPMYIYKAQIEVGKIRRKSFEIRDAQWFSVADLPADTVLFVKHLLKEK